jgi:hypothetical protein
MSETASSTFPDVDRIQIESSLRSMVVLSGLGDLSARDLAVAGLAMGVGYMLRSTLDPAVNLDIARTELTAISERWLAQALGEIEASTPLA